METPLDGGGVLLAVRGELDISIAPDLRDRLAALTHAGVRRLVLDLLGVSFMDSTALAALIHTKTRLGGEGRMAVVIAPDSYARLILEAAGIAGHILDVVETLDEGIARVAR